ncbi:DUF1735 domain-containing protein, partial [Bacteroides caecimuris]|uniref:BT_3987 domain-containing protein n=1 Tax=Bacteroides caecimuris TaxID=1796613 RepID=UPI0026479052
MKIYKTIQFIVAVLLIASACTDERDNFMVNDQIGLLNSTYTETEVFRGMNDPYQLYVIKSGKGKQETEVSISVDETVLQNYNTDNGSSIRLLPSDCYTILQPTLRLSNSDYRKAFDIKWNIERLSDLLSAGEEYALPIQMNVLQNSISVDNERVKTIIVPTIKNPYLQMDVPGMSPVTDFIPTFGDLNERELYVKVKTNYSNDEDVSFRIEVDPELVAHYNTANGTDYKVLPEDAFTVDDKGMILAGMKETFIKIKYYKKGLIPQEETYLFGDYILPLRITSVSKYDIDPDAASKLYTVKFQPDPIDKKGWSVIDFNNCCTQDGGWYLNMGWGVESLIDNSPGTQWLCRWDVKEPLPYYFVFDMGKEYTIFRFGFANPVAPAAHVWAGTSKAGYVEASIDNEN